MVNALCESYKVKTSAGKQFQNPSETHCDGDDL